MSDLSRLLSAAAEVSRNLAAAEAHLVAHPGDFAFALGIATAHAQWLADAVVVARAPARPEPTDEEINELIARQERDADRCTHPAPCRRCEP